ncbi:MAG: hydrogenase [Deltaproteobacteria bacterium CG2_30_63_29]|nr:MAG: hydrogenase [Deltaproteobacteria bacterium CG2_30_63_29]PJB35580.1 MAG: hydrogenase [Deltaproteobacteria bacterium CG_4_9_14_3_um_filter_63_12]
MSTAVDPVLVLVLMLNFLVLGTSRLRAAINASALQGAFLGTLVVLVHGGFAVRPIMVGAAAIAIKGIIIPGLLHRALRDVAIRREIEPYVSFVTSLLLCAVATGAAVLFAGHLPLAPEHDGSLLIPASLATVLTGFLILTTRRKAITQVVGYLVLENGIFIMGVSLQEAMPSLVEVGVLLDLVVAIFVIGIVLNHINQEFASQDVDQLDKLKE